MKKKESMVLLFPIVYNPYDPSTDFYNLIRDEKYDDAIFLFNDNFHDRNCSHPGGNSARIRPFTFQNPPKAMGISTGWSSGEGGFRSLNKDVEDAIFICFEVLNLLLFDNPHIKRVFYSCDRNNHKSLGYAIFSPCKEVISFITEKIQNIPKRHSQQIAISKTALSILEDRLERRILHKDDPLMMTDHTAYVQKFKQRKRVREVCSGFSF